MESIVHLDTNVVIWLYTGCIEQFSAEAKKLIEASVLMISPIVTLELAYLKEVGRLHDEPRHVVDDLRDRVGLSIDATSFGLIIDQALQMSWTRDPFDRLIVAQAASFDRRLVTKDAKILQHYEHAIW